MAINSKSKGKRGNANAEVWKPIIGYEGLYEVSSLGRVKSLPRETTKGGIMKLYKNSKNGYKYVGLCKGNKKATRRVHVLVMESFAGYSSGNGLVVDHIDCDKTNNQLENLELVTQKENDRRSRENHLQEITGTPVIDLDTQKVYRTYTEAARDIGGRTGEMVARVCRGERSHYRGHRFAKVSDYEAGTIPLFSGKHKRSVSKSLWR